MSSKETSLGLLAVAGIVVALPFSVGCGGGPAQFTEDFNQGSTSRIAFISTKPNGANDGIVGEATAAGTDSAEISADGTTASFEAEQQSSPDPQSNFARNHSFDPSEVYTDGDNSAVVTNRPTGLNEQNDTFLTFHEQHVDGETEYTTAYTGTRSDADVVTNLRARTQHGATYTGTGSAYVGQGDFAYNLDGGLQMNAQFAGQNPGITGTITDTTVQGATQDNPNGVNQVTFTGNFIDESPDFNISDIKLNATSTATTNNPSGQIATIDEGGGVGSFFGANAQGTMGVFSGSGSTTNSGGGANESPVNVIGSFQGKTTDNNPAH